MIAIVQPAAPPRAAWLSALALGLALLLLPDCCLSGRHAHATGFEPLGVVCRALR